MNKEEYIEREEALLQLTGVNLPEDTESYMQIVTKRLKNLEKAKVRPIIYSKWIDTEKGDTCMACGYAIEGNPKTYFVYCPVCGAEMVY